MRYFTVQEVAGQLQLTPTTIRRYIRAGRLRANKLSSKMLRISEEDLAYFMDVNSNHASTVADAVFDRAVRECLQGQNNGFG